MRDIIDLSVPTKALPLLWMACGDKNEESAPYEHGSEGHAQDLRRRGQSPTKGHAC